MEENNRLVKFLYDGDKVIAERDDTKGLKRYIRGYELVSSDCEQARTYYHYASDELGSITDVLNYKGEVLNHYEYDAFGEFSVREEQVENRFAFAGEQFDPATNLYYLRARFYNPVIGRFIQEDTYYGDGLNLYAYCHNNPVGYVDPSGHDGVCPAKQEAINEIAKKNGLSIAEATKQYEKLRNSGKYKKMSAEQIRDVLTGKSCPDGRMSMAGKKHPITGIVFDSKGYPIFTSLYDMNLLPEDYTKTSRAGRTKDFIGCTV